MVSVAAVPGDAAGELLAPIDFYFDFSSPYGYLASELIDAVGARHGRRVVWHAVLLGAAFRATGGQPPSQQPIKGDYFRTDFQRSARYHDIPLRMPAGFPVSSLHATRSFAWLGQQDEALARRFAHAVFRAYFTAERPIDQLDTVLDIARSLGIDRAALAEALTTQSLKDATRLANDRALARGVFGSPFFIVDGESFWGVDRLPQLERWLSEGGF
ncbi:2-hydroxychromene-2-carboxylate isomerase [Viridibacterium curvum]|uniref:2-hydroxychromene-2-carboxylate isomerase n=1 Tax=Viridibacterium curvum TaxID=1101404 RepID=A0ABP9QN45_9RHOO